MSIFSTIPQKPTQAHTTTLEAEIPVLSVAEIPVLSVVETDQLVYEFYGLTEEEIKIVEESVK